MVVFGGSMAIGSFEVIWSCNGADGKRNISVSVCGAVMSECGVAMQGQPYMSICSGWPKLSRGSSSKTDDEPESAMTKYKHHV